MRVGTIAFSLVLLASWLGLPPPALAQQGADSAGQRAAVHGGASMTSTQFGGLHVMWDNCVNPDLGAGEPPATLDEDFDCTTPHQYKLHGTFKLGDLNAPVDLPNFFGMDIAVDLYWSDAFEIPRAEALEPFWHFETGGCNASGLALSVDKSSSGGCGLSATPWGESGDQATSVNVIAYGPDFFGQLGFGRFIASIYRAQDDPFPLSGNTEYYAFHLVWNTDQAGGCAGCDDRMLVYWLTATLYSNEGGTVVPFVVLGSVPCSDCGPADYVTINGRDFPTAAMRPTWGQIKSQYR